MTPPAVAAWRLAVSGLLGLGLGLAYDFFRPLRHRHLADLLFLPILFWAWLFLGFFVCRGDLRPGYWTGLGIGFWVWRMTLSRFIRPIFAGFWKIITLPLELLKKFLIKMRIFLKNLLADGKKSSTIDKPQTLTEKGDRYGPIQESPGEHPAGLQAQQQRDKNRRSERHRHLHSGASDPGQRHSGRRRKSRRTASAGIPSGAG
jgi:hypothetical protein